MPPRKLELTLAILKPDLMARPQHVQAVRQLALDDGFFFVRSRECRVSLADAQRFYEEHRGKFFFQRLTSFLSSGLISVHVLARENAIKRWRELQGPTQILKAKIESPDSIRARFGLTDTRNATHGADSLSAAKREIAFFFPDFSLDDWFKEEPFFRKDKSLNFDAEKWFHKIKS